MPDARKGATANGAERDGARSATEITAAVARVVHYTYCRATFHAPEADLTCPEDRIPARIESATFELTLPLQDHLVGHSVA